MTREWPDWFSGGYAQQSFERNLSSFAGLEDFRALQIGAYCGDASEWLLKNILTGSGSWLVDVDTWEGSDEDVHREMDWMKIRAFYQERMNGYTNRSAFMVSSDSFFKISRLDSFHFVYVDGAHNAEQVLRDAVNAARVICVGGLIAFDDYLWADGTLDIPRPAIDAFLQCYEKRFEVLEKDLQVWVRRLR